MLPKIILITAAILISACTGTDDSATPESSSKAPPVQGITETEIILGSHNDLSGPTAVLGVSAVNGVRMRFDEANADGGIHGRTIRFVVEDAGYQVPRAIQAANKLIHRDKVFAMVMAMGTPMNNAIMPTLFESGIPNLFPISGARSMVEPFRPLQVTGRGIYYDEIRAATRYFVEERGASTPCIVYQDTDYGQEILEGAEEQLAAMGLSAAEVSSHKTTDVEFTAAVLKMKDAGCDLVLMGTVYRDTILILEAARKLGWQDVVWVGNNASYNEGVARLESGAGEGYSVFSHIALPYRDGEISEAVADWWDRYQERFNAPPEYSAMEGYRNADVVVRALEAAGPEPTGEKVIAAIQAMGEHIDPFGYRMTFGADDHKGVDESVLLTVVDGRWQVQAEKITY